MMVKAKHAWGMCKSELDVLRSVQSPFICSVGYAFEDEEYLYLALDLMTGGSVEYNIEKKEKFNHDEAQYYATVLAN